MIVDLTFAVFYAAQGYGAKGLNEYEFSLEFLSPVKSKVCVHDQISLG